jgi:hypothetical protein
MITESRHTFIGLAKGRRSSVKRVGSLKEINRLKAELSKPGLSPQQEGYLHTKLRTVARNYINNHRSYLHNRALRKGAF